MRLAHGPQAGQRLLVGLLAALDRRHVHFHGGQVNVEEKVDLAAIVVIDLSLGRPENIGHVVDARRREALLHECLRSRVEDDPPAALGLGRMLAPLGGG